MLQESVLVQSGREFRLRREIHYPVFGGHFDQREIVSNGNGKERRFPGLLNHGSTLGFIDGP